MRNLAIVLLLAAACASPQPAQTTSQPAATPEAPAATRPQTPGSIPIPARGLTCNSAIVIDASSERDGIARENAWIAENYPGAKKVRQDLLTCNDKPADAIKILTANGQDVTLFFDISQFFGKH